MNPLLKTLFLLPALIVGLGLTFAATTTAQTLTTLHSFMDYEGYSTDGVLTLSSNILYGTASEGGTNNNGTVFKVNTDGTGFTTLHTFTAFYVNSDGAIPQGSLILSGNTLYGTATVGGSSGNGTVFAVHTDGAGFTALHSFTNGNDGSNPYGGLVLSGNILYGTASEGGSSGNGTVFAVHTDGTGFTTLHAFTAFFDDTNNVNSDGAFPFPYDGLILSGNILYGTASEGGTNGNGTVFKVNTDGTGFTTLHTFTAFSDDTNYVNSDGAYPQVSLILSGNILYGTASVGGSSGNGTVFAVHTDGTGFVILHSFTAIDPAYYTNSDGANPAAGLFISGNILYGTAAGGGISRYGTVFAVHTDGTGFTTLQTFDFYSDGAFPFGGLILSGNILYGTTTYGGTNGHGTVFSLSTSLITPLRVPSAQSAVAPTDLIDASIVPVASSNALATVTNPLGLGVVADGVTPVLFRIMPGLAGNYSIVASNLASGYPALLTNLFVLQGSSWIQTNNFSISGSSGTNLVFAYLRGLEWTSFIGLSTSNDVPFTLNMVTNGGATPIASATFRIRPPPVVLVHGYNANSNSWGSAFLNVLQQSRPADFVIAIEYGVNYAAQPPELINTIGRLDELAQVLDNVLTNTVENKNAGLAVNWDFTRYDIVGHSQGGVLTRMLCTKTPFFSFVATPFSGEANMYRGRFRRIVTIGSPHNGSLLLHYMLQLKQKTFNWRRIITWKMGDLLQDKFDPFGQQILEINNPLYLIDERAKLRLIRCTINGGYSPGLYFTLADGLIGLNCLVPNTNLFRGEIVLPRGSDGVVDFDSEEAGIQSAAANISDLAGFDISHADAFPIFGVLPDQSETTFAPVATEVIRLLNGSPTLFDKFSLPPTLPPSLRNAIDSIVPAVEFFNLVSASPSVQPHCVNCPTSYYFQLNPPASRPVQGQIAWFAEVFTTNGVTSDGVTLTADTNNPNAIIVTVDYGVIGDVVLHAVYSSTNGNLIVAQPMMVVSRPVGTLMNGIHLNPALASSLSLGDSLTTIIWGDYTNGSSSALFLTNGAASYVSSNPSIATVDSYGTITVNSFGSAAIAASYNGFTAQTIVSTITPSVNNLSVNQLTNGGLQLNFKGTVGATNIIQASTNLLDWMPVASIVNSNGFVQYTDSLSTNFSMRYYRVKIP